MWAQRAVIACMMGALVGPAVALSAPQASPLNPAAPERGHRFVADLRVNGQPKGTQIFVEKEGVLYLEASVWAELLGLAHPPQLGQPGVRRLHDRAMVDPMLAAPGVQIERDEAKGSVSLSVPGASFGSRTVYLNRQEVPPPVSSAPSVFVNYALGSDRQGMGSVYLEGGWSRGTQALLSSAMWSANSGWQRGLTRWEHDDPVHLRRWTVGDQLAVATDGLGGATGIAGVGFERAFDLNPYLTLLPQPKVVGVLQSPGTLEIYKNGVLVGTRPVQPGVFNLENLGVAVGSNNLRVVVRDPFGGTQDIQQNFYAGHDTLAEGLTDYAYRVGVASPVPGQTYQPHNLVFMANQRWGLAHGWTVGYRAEGERGVLNAGADVSMGSPLGEFHAASALSHGQEGRGWAQNLDYSVAFNRVSLTLGGSVYSDGYRKLGDNTLMQPLDDAWLFQPDATGDQPPTLQAVLAAQRPRAQWFASVGYNPVGHLYVQGTYSHTRYADAHLNDSASVGLSYDFGGASVYVGASQSHVESRQDRSAMLTLTLPLGRSSLTLGNQVSGGARVRTLDVQRNLTMDNGYGYAAHLEQSGAAGWSGAGTFTAQNSWSRVSAQFVNAPMSHAASLEVAGSVIAIDRTLHFGRPLDGPFALIRVGDHLDHIPVTVENQVVGTTRPDGTLLVTDLHPYEANHVGFDSYAVPSTDSVPSAHEVISLPRHGGSVVDFHVRRLSAARGQLLGPTGLPIQYATIIRMKRGSAAWTSLDAPTGSKGNFYLQDVSAGNYTLLVRHEGRQFQCGFQVGVTDTHPVHNVGRIPCQVGLHQAE